MRAQTQRVQTGNATKQRYLSGKTFMKTFAESNVCGLIGSTVP